MKGGEDVYEKPSSVLRRWTFRNRQGVFTSQRFFSSYPNHEVIGLPALSPTMETGTIVEWKKKEGDVFEPGDIICDVETDKATVSFDAHDEGVVAKILAPTGSKDIKIGDPIMVVVQSKEDVDAFKDYSMENNQHSPSKSPEVADKVPTDSVKSSGTQTTVSSVEKDNTLSTGNEERVFASPLARKMARERGIDITEVLGSGPRGRITKKDVEAFIPKSETVSPRERLQETQAIDSEMYTDYPVSDISRAYSTRLAQAKQTVPHYYLNLDVSVDAILELRERLNKDMPEEEHITVYDFLIKAAATAMKEVPEANATWMETFVRQYKSVDINLMIGSGDDIRTPVLKDVRRLGLRDIGHEVRRSLVDLREDIGGGDEQTGTFTVANMGMYGIKSYIPIINTPQACMLAIGGIESRVVPHPDPESEEFYKMSKMVTVCLSCDHRVIDGAVAAKWLQTYKMLVEDPITMLL